MWCWLGMRFPLHNERAQCVLYHVERAAFRHFERCDTFRLCAPLSATYELFAAVRVLFYE